MKLKNLDVRSDHRNNNTVRQTKTRKSSPPSEVTSKNCSRCGLIKSTQCFGVKRQNQIGLSRWDGVCKQCDRQLRKKRYDKAKAKKTQFLKGSKVLDFDSVKLKEFTKPAEPIANLIFILRSFAFELVISSK